MDYPRMLVLEPRNIWWEANGVCNPAVVELHSKIHLLYRAVGADNISRLGLAVSGDGESFQRLDLPVVEASSESADERLGLEDPRAVRLGREIVITYTAASVYQADEAYRRWRDLKTLPRRTRLSALSTVDLRHFKRLGVLLRELDSTDGVLLARKIQGRYQLLHRISSAIYLSSSPTLSRFDGGLQLIAPVGSDSWQAVQVGVAAPPLGLEEGQLLIYYGVDKHGRYGAGAALLHKENPAVVLKRARTPFLTLRFDWEKSGRAGNVILPTGYILRRGSLYLYYGAANRVVGLAKVPLEEVLTTLNESVG